MIGEIFSLIAGCSFSTGNVAVRRGMRKARDTGVFVSTSISALVFLIIISVLYLRDLLPPLSVPGFWLFVLAGLFTSFLGRSLHYAAISVIGPSRATSFRASSPVVTVGLAFAFLSERFTPLQFVGATAIISGVILLSREAAGRTDLEVVRENPRTLTADVIPGRRSFLGVLYGLAAALSFGAGHFMRKLALKEVPSPFWGLAVGTTAAWLALVLHAASRGDLRELWKDNFNVHAPPWFFILGGIFTTAGQMFLFLGIYLTAVSTAMVLASTEPLGSLLISRLLLGKEEPLNWRVVFCCCSVFLGIILMIV